MCFIISVGVQLKGRIYGKFRDRGQRKRNNKFALGKLCEEQYSEQGRKAIKETIADSSVGSRHVENGI
jgi:hypothetical protein